MKMHKVTMYVVDLQDYGVGDFILNTEQSNSDCVIHARDVEVCDIGEWSDEHPTNRNDIPTEQLEQYFN